MKFTTTSHFANKFTYIIILCLAFAFVIVGVIKGITDYKYIKNGQLVEAEIISINKEYDSKGRYTMHCTVTFQSPGEYGEESKGVFTVSSLRMKEVQSTEPLELVYIESAPQELRYPNVYIHGHAECVLPFSFSILIVIIAGCRYTFIKRRLEREGAR